MNSDRDWRSRAEFDHAERWPLPLPPAPEQDVDDTPAVAGSLIRTARWHAGLSQDELAARAGTSQQTLLRYESGRTQPTLPTLVRLLRACGMGLDPTLLPRIELDDPGITDVLRRPPLERIPLPHRDAVRVLLPLLVEAEVPFAITGKLAARLYGAPVRLYDCDFAIPEDTVRVVDVEGPLTAAGGRSFLPLPIEDAPAGADDSTDNELLGRHLSLVSDAEVRFATVEEFDLLLGRARTVKLDGHAAPVLAVPDVMRPWHQRDRDRLLLARATMQRQRADERFLS